MKIEEIRTDNLLRLIKEHGTQQALANKIGISVQQLNQWVKHPVAMKSGKPRYISDRSCRKIEAIIGLHDRWFDTDHNEEPDDVRYMDDDEIKQLGKIPLYERPQWDEMHNKGKPIKWIGHVSEGISPDTYALEIKDDSLVDIKNKIIIRKTDIVIIDPDRKPKDGSYVMATSSKYKLASFKVYRVQDGNEYLYTPNPDWQERWIPIDDSIALHGVVIEVIKIVED